MRMPRLVRSLVLVFTLITASGAWAGGTFSIAVYSGFEKIKSVGGGNSTSGVGSSTGRDRQSVYLCIDTGTGEVQRVIVEPRRKRFRVESAVQFFDVTASTEGRKRKEFLRLMLVNHTEPQAGEFTNTSSIYDGQVLDSVTVSADLAVPYPRVLKWTFFFEYSGFEVAPPGVTTFPQIDTGSATLSLDKRVTKAAAGKSLSQAVDIVRGVLTQRRFLEEI